MIKQTCFKIGTCILLILLIFQILPQASTGASASSAAPFVTILSPAMADTFGVYENVFLQGTSITISAEASSSEGISQMVIMDGDMAIKAFRVSEGTLSNNSNTSKISWNWTNASPGEHTITVRAYSAVTNIRSTDWTYIVVTPAVEIDEVYIGDSTAPLDGEFENYTDTTGNVLPTGWGGDTFYADGGRILAGSPGRNSSSCLYMATTDSTKNISPYIQAGNYSGLSGTLVFEMDIMRGSESNSVDLRTIVTGYVAGSSTAQILFFMKRGTFQAALKDGSYLEFGKYARNQWYNVKMVVHVLSGLMDLYIDGTKKLSGIEMRLNPANLKSIRISHASTNATGETYLDNIKFYRYEVSGPVVRDVWFTDGTGNKTEPALHIPLGTEKITLRFYDPVAPSSCAAAVRLRTDSGDAVPFSGSYNTSEKSYTLTLLQSLCPKTKYVLECGTELTDTTDSPLAYKRLWVFATEASEYKVNGPRFFSGGEEILILSEAAEGTLHITASVSQNKSAPSVITAAAAIYQNGRMTGAAMQDKTVTSVSSADFALDLDFPGYTENTEVKFFVWDNMKPVYIETLTAKRGVPIIRSGFENTTITTPDNKRYYLHGADTSLPAPNDWDALTYDPVVVSGFPHINTEAGTSAERVPSITADPVNPFNKVLHSWQGQVTTASKARVDFTIYFNKGIREVYCKQRVFLHNDFNKLLTYPGAIEWLSVIEFWNENGWSDRLFPYRLTVGLHKPAGTADGLHFNVTTEKAETGNFVEIWQESNVEFKVPIGQWMTWEVYYREGDANTGRFILAVTPDGGQRRVVFNVNNWTYAPGNPNPGGLPIMHPMKMYTSKGVVNYLHDNSGALQIYRDDFELYRDGR